MIVRNASGGGGVKLPALTNPADAGKIIAGYEAIDGKGAPFTGSLGTGITNPAGAGQIFNGYEAIGKSGDLLKGIAGADITSPATAAKIALGFQALDKAGRLMTGTMVSYYRQLHTYKATSTRNNSSTSLKATGSTIDLAVAYCTQTNSSAELFGGFAVVMNNELLYDDFGMYTASNVSLSGTTIEVVLNYRDITQNNDNDPLNLNILIFSH